MFQNPGRNGSADGFEEFGGVALDVGTQPDGLALHTHRHGAHLGEFAHGLHDRQRAGRDDVLIDGQAVEFDGFLA